MAQSDLGVSYRGCLGDQEIVMRGPGSGPGVPDTGTSQQQPVMVKTIELKERANKDKVKIRSVIKQ